MSRKQSFGNPVLTDEIPPHLGLHFGQYSNASCWFDCAEGMIHEVADEAWLVHAGSVTDLPLGVWPVCARLAASRPGRALTVREVGALSDFDDIAVRIADVAADLAVLGDRLRDELGSSTFPQSVARLDIRNPEIHKAVDVIRVGDAERDRWLIRSRPSANVQNHPDIRKLKVPRRVAVTQAQNASAEDFFVVASRSLDVGDGEKMRDADPILRGHLIALLIDLYAH